MDPESRDSLMAGSDFDAFQSGSAAAPLSDVERHSAQTQMTPIDVMRDFSAHGHASSIFQAPGMKEGDKLGNYMVKGVLGRGGFGTVYRAVDERLGREVAIKFLTDVRDERMLKLFEREARVIAALSKHPSVVQIFEWGELGGCPYFVLEMMDHSASLLTEQSPEGIPAETALHITAECASALAYAHERGILHRDIKPANILMDHHENRAKLADFGLARFRAANDDMTISGTVSGSPPFMSPEQATGAPLDQRSDIYSLGVTLYKLLCNRLPYEGSSALEIMARIREGNYTPISEHLPGLPKEIVQIVHTAIAPAPEHRYQTADDFEKALRRELRVLHGEEVAAPSPGEARTVRMQNAPVSRWRMRVASLVAAAVVLGVVGFVGPQLMQRAGMPAVDGAYAQAREDLESGRYAEAEQAYRAILASTPDDEIASYGLVFTLLRSNKIDDAAAAAQAMPADTELGREARAAVDAAKDPASVGALPEDTLTPYLKVQRARQAMAEQKYDEALQAIGKPSPDSFQFTWQYVEAMQSLGQAHFRLGDYEAARQVFEQALTMASDQQKAVLGAYLKQAGSKLDAGKRAEALERAKELKALVEQGYEPPQPADLWRSRPLTYFIMPPEVPAGASAALSTGLADLLPELLGESLSQTPMQLVDREIINDVLAEQQLATLVGKDGGLALRQVLGARFILRPRFRALRGQETLSIDVVDVEVTSKLVVRSEAIDPAAAPDEFVNTVAHDLWAKVRDAYPIQGRIYQEDKQVLLDVGADVGVAQGMQFQLKQSPDGTPLTDAAASIQAVQPNTSLVSLEGIEQKLIPSGVEKAWYVVQAAPPPA